MYLTIGVDEDGSVAMQTFTTKTEAMEDFDESVESEMNKSVALISMDSLVKFIVSTDENGGIFVTNGTTIKMFAEGKIVDVDGNEIQK